jgi:hypothetical protein
LLRNVRKAYYNRTTTSCVIQLTLVAGVTGVLELHVMFVSRDVQRPLRWQLWVALIGQAHRSLFDGRRLITSDALPKITSAKVYSLLRSHMRDWADRNGFSAGKDARSWIRPYRRIYIRVRTGVNRYGWLDGIGGEFRVEIESGLDARIDGGTSLLTTMFGSLMTDGERQSMWALSRIIASAMPANSEGLLFGWPYEEGFQPTSEIWMVYRNVGDIEAWARLFIPLIGRHVDLVAPGWTDETTTAVSEDAFADRFPRVRALFATVANGLREPVSDLSARIRPTDAGRLATPMTCRITTTSSGTATIRFSGDSSYAISTTPPGPGSTYSLQVGRETLGMIRVVRVEWLTSPEQASYKRISEPRASMSAEWTKHRLIMRPDQAPPSLAL